MKILVGLGNPGDKYEQNRHNVGFMAVEAIAEHYGAGPWKRRFQGMAAEAEIGRERCLLLKPTTFMNESGRAVGEAIRFYKISPADVIVFHDELDLEPGRVRVKFGGGHAGHNGLKSISAHIGNDYHRARIGIGHPGSREAVVSYVLHDFSKKDREWLEPLLSAVAAGAPHLLAGQDAKFLNEIARVSRPVAEASMPAPHQEKRPMGAAVSAPQPAMAAADVVPMPPVHVSPPSAPPPPPVHVSPLSSPSPPAPPASAAPAVPMPEPAMAKSAVSPAPAPAERKLEPAMAEAAPSPRPSAPAYKPSLAPGDSFAAKLKAWFTRR
jgi:PTH1 family peptidyl-tRNA hydrolase